MGQLPGMVFLAGYKGRPFRNRVNLPIRGEKCTKRFSAARGGGRFGNVIFVAFQPCNTFVRASSENFQHRLMDALVHGCGFPFKMYMHLKNT